MKEIEAAKKKYYDDGDIKGASAIVENLLKTLSDVKPGDYDWSKKVWAALWDHNFSRYGIPENLLRTREALREIVKLQLNIVPDDFWFPPELIAEVEDIKREVASESGLRLPRKRSKRRKPAPVEAAASVASAEAPPTVETPPTASVPAIESPKLVPPMRPSSTHPEAVTQATVNSQRQWMKLTAYVTGGVGLAALGVAGVFGLKASQEKDQLSSYIARGSLPMGSPRSDELHRSIEGNSQRAQIFLWGGALTLGAAGALWLFAPPDTIETTPGGVVARF